MYFCKYKIIAMNRIKDVLKEKNISINEFADMVGCPVSL